MSPLSGYSGGPGRRLPLPQPEPLREPLPLYMGDEPVIGYRIWRVELEQRFRVVDGELRSFLSRAELGSVGRPVHWPKREALHATCKRDPQHLHPSHRAPWPDGGCACGVWAFKDANLPTLALSAYQSPIGRSPAIALARAQALRPFTVSDCEMFAIGTVKLWGRVVECERGWRGEFAYPERIELVGGPWVPVGPPDAAALDGETALYDEHVRDVLSREYGIPVSIRPRLSAEETMRAVHQSLTLHRSGQLERLHRLDLLSCLLALAAVAFLAIAYFQSSWPQALNIVTATAMFAVALNGFRLSRRIRRRLN